MNVLAFGEILFDCYPTADKIGGAPFNFSAHLAQLGASVFLYSAVGDDALGKKAIHLAKEYGVNTGYLAVCADYPTGICKVTYRGTEPDYDLRQESAYDHIPSPEPLFGKSFDVLYFGTLACRNETSKASLRRLQQNCRFETVFFDMNLRQNYYSKALVKEGLVAADIVKMNREEFSYVKEISNISDSDIASALHKICQRYEIKTAILTLDSDGACVWDNTDGFQSVPAKATEFISAVGAGDSFCACFLYHYKMGHPLSVCLEKASLLAGFVVSREEAIPLCSKDFLKNLQTI